MSFNEMTSHIDALIRQNYDAELNEKNARIAALEAQLNPHFLYNTLQAIGSEALLHDEDGIYSMLTALAGGLRYSIKASNIVTLEEEMNYVDSYVMLQKIRMGERLTVIRRIEPDTGSKRVPKISVQALVENSILHGIRGDRNAVTITIEAFRRGDYLIIRVTDNGAGIEEQALEELRAAFTGQTASHFASGIGLANLYHRCRLMYENDADLMIDSKTREDSYTTVTLILSSQPPDNKGED